MTGIYHSNSENTNRTNKRTQQQRILELLLQGFRQRREIPLPEILALRISQFGTRIKELREAGWDIRNRQDSVEGQRRSWYSLKSAIQTAATGDKPLPAKSTEAVTSKPGWRSQPFSFGNPSNYNGTRKDPQPVTQSFGQSLLWETGKTR